MKRIILIIFALCISCEQKPDENRAWVHNDELEIIETNECVGGIITCPNHPLTVVRETNDRFGIADANDKIQIFDAGVYFYLTDSNLFFDDRTLTITGWHDSKGAVQ